MCVCVYFAIFLDNSLLWFKFVRILLSYMNWVINSVELDQIKVIAMLKLHI